MPSGRDMRSSGKIRKGEKKKKGMSNEFSTDYEGEMDNGGGCDKAGDD